MALAITPYFFNLIDVNDPECPIRKQVVPRIEEMTAAPWEMVDPCGEDEHMPVPGLVHRYPDRVLFLVTDRCAAYCRYCTRSRVVSGAGEQHLHTEFTAAINYIREYMEALRGHTTGYAVPQYVIDAPGGGGKVPVAPDYVLAHHHERILIRNYEGQVFEYPEPTELTSAVPPAPVGSRGEAAVLAIRSALVQDVPASVCVEATHGRHS